MQSLSPYENIRANERYPSMLMRSPPTDAGVAKWTAKLQASQVTGAACDPDPRVIIHSTQLGESSDDYTRQRAVEYAFIIKEIEQSKGALAAKPK